MTQATSQSARTRLQPTGAAGQALERQRAIEAALQVVKQAKADGRRLSEAEIIDALVALIDRKSQME